MEPLDSTWVKEQLSAPPFVTIEGVSNVRSLGNYASTLVQGHYTKPNFAYRAGEISGITTTGKKQLHELGIKKVFDLRSDTEVVKFGTPPPDLDPQAKILHVPVFKNEDYSPEMIARRYKLYATGKVESFMELYSQILDHGVMAFRSIFNHIRDEPNEAFLFHCTAGKDRTGVVAALILKLSGVDDEIIAKDYELTRVGREPQRAVIAARLAKEPTFAEDRQAALNMLSSRHETMVAFLELLDKKYGGVENYLKSRLGYSVVDVAQIQRHLILGARL